MPQKKYPAVPEFHLGITMAGAASAGCYTGGAMDYIFEVLDKWEQAKKSNIQGWKEEYNYLVPQHKVIIDVMGGTSAGGMTTTMAAIYALENKIKPAVFPEKKDSPNDNIFYKSWVKMADGRGDSTFSQLWEQDDLQDPDAEKWTNKLFKKYPWEKVKIKSLLNSGFLDVIAKDVFNLSGDLAAKIANLPSYISPDLEILHTLCMLKGIPLEIDFGTPIADTLIAKEIPVHKSFEHFTLAHYKLDPKKPGSEYLWLNPYDHSGAATLRLTTQATGAYPIGLAFQEIKKDEHFSEEYLRQITNKIVLQKFVGNENSDVKINFQSKKLFSSLNKFVVVDGGAINNEPFDEVLAILNKKHPKAANEAPAKYPRFGLVMIDPLPQKVDGTRQSEFPDELSDIIPAFIAALRQQSKVKRAEMLSANGASEYIRGEIFPLKKGKNKEEFPIASHSVMAFGGLLDQEFRKHDFSLGRDNARKFFQYWFTLEYFGPGDERTHPIHRDWSPQMIEKFKVGSGKGNYEMIFLPIIPDMSLIERGITAREAMLDAYTMPHLPQFNPEALFRQRKNIQGRLLRIILLAYKKLYQKNTHKPGNSPHQLTDEWMEEYYHKNLLKKTGRWTRKKAAKAAFHLLVKKRFAKDVTEKIIIGILKDLEKRGILEPLNKAKKDTPV